MRKVILIAGTRPEVIKLAPIYLELRRSKEIMPVFLSTGQHREMLAQAFAAFDFVPDHDLNLMTAGQTLPQLTSKIIDSVSVFLREHRPSAVIVQGDTTTVLSSALAAFYERIPIAHVEAGLRTYNIDSPWPEEMNRRLVSPLCRWHFTPTEESRRNLEREHVSPDSIYVTGNTVIDALLFTRDAMVPSCASRIFQRLGVPTKFVTRFLGNPESRWILVTGHRRESFGKGIEDISRALLKLCDMFPDLGIIYPVHLNPKVREPVNRMLGRIDRIALCGPASYRDFVWLMQHCQFILSDSGGVQEEAPSLGKPVLVTRNTTERPEGVTSGTCKLVGTDPLRICREAKLLLEDADEYSKRSALKNPYGDGRAAVRIAEILERDLCEEKRFHEEQ